MSKAVRGLGEVALRVIDLECMQAFYQNVVGLELMRRFEKAVFFRLAEGFGGHMQVLALFDRTADPNFSGLDSEKATRNLDHFGLRDRVGRL